MPLLLQTILLLVAAASLEVLILIPPIFAMVPLALLRVGALRVLLSLLVLLSVLLLLALRTPVRNSPVIAPLVVVLLVLVFPLVILPVRVVVPLFLPLSLVRGLLLTVCLVPTSVIARLLRLIRLEFLLVV